MFSCQQITFTLKIFQKRLSVLDIVMYDFIPSFTASYALFAVSAYQVSMFHD